jgi:hypothetical protein
VATFVGVYLFNLFIMIYKLKSTDADSTLEVEQINESSLELKITENYSDRRNEECVYLNKNQVYKLIGVLHLIQKEMEAHNE